MATGAGSAVALVGSRLTTTCPLKRAELPWTWPTFGPSAVTVTCDFMMIGRQRRRSGQKCWRTWWQPKPPDNQGFCRVFFAVTPKTAIVYGVGRSLLGWWQYPKPPERETNVTNAQKIRLRLSQVRSRLNEISGLEGDAFTDEVRSEAVSLQTEYGDLEIRSRAALVGEEKDEKTPITDDAEMRERVALRSKASLTNYLLAAMRGRQVTGPEAELRDAAGTGDGIPLELWDVPQTETRQTDDVAGAPGTTGINLDRIRPAVFSQSIAPRLGIEMPRVKSGTYASATISTSLSAGSQAKGGRQDATAAAFTVTSVAPKRISARLGIAVEDVAAVGQANYEAILRENTALVLSAELDDQAINGAGAGSDLIGIFERLGNPTAPGATAASFDDFVAAFAGGIDGLWASSMDEVAVVCGPTTYRLSAQSFRDRVIDTGQRGGVSLGATSFADYAMAKFGGWWTNKRMPDAASNIQQAILYRKGRSMMGGAGAMRTAVCPYWNEIGIDDIYSGSAQGERYFTMHVLLGDVILVQPDAYAQVSFRTAV